MGGTQPLKTPEKSGLANWFKAGYALIAAIVATAFLIFVPSPPKPPEP
jgi:hypothetical protein